MERFKFALLLVFAGLFSAPSLAGSFSKDPKQIARVAISAPKNLQDAMILLAASGASTDSLKDVLKEAGPDVKWNTPFPDIKIDGKDRIQVDGKISGITVASYAPF